MFKNYTGRKIIFLLAFGISGFAYCQSIKGTVFDSSFFNKHIFLSETIGNHNYKIDSVVISSNGNFSFLAKNYPKGYYYFSVNDSNRADIILNPSEKEVVLEFKKPQLQNGINIISSIENKILWEYKFFSKSVYNGLMDIYVQKSYIHLPPQNGKDSVLLKDLQQKEDSLNDYKMQQLARICEKYPETYFAKSAKSSLRKKYADKVEAKKHFFETMDFSDASLIRSVTYPVNMMDYLQTYTQYNEAGFKSSVDTILGKAKVNPEVYEFCLNYLLELFDRVGPDIIFQYLTEKYLIGEGCSEINVSESFKTKAEAYRLLLPGNKAPEIALPDSNRKELIVSEIANKNKITVLFFWSSHCQFCHKAIPDVKEVYSKYHAQGLEIVAISLDENIEIWKEHIADNEFHWLNVCDLKGWKSPVVEKYKIHKTPSFYLLDNNMFILAKPQVAEDLKNVVEQNLK